ncbi:hypothetical protein ACFFRR_001470 [Megaselia abdita]
MNGSIFVFFFVIVPTLVDSEAPDILTPCKEKIEKYPTDMAKLLLKNDGKVTVKLAELEYQYRACLGAVQKLVWYEMQREKIILEFNVYLKIEQMRIAERLNGLAQQSYEKGKDFYPTPNKPLSVE